MRHQTSGSITLDMATMADALAESLGPKLAPPVLIDSAAIGFVAMALPAFPDPSDPHSTAVQIVRRLAELGVSLTQTRPAPTTEPAETDWFSTVGSDG